jgi:hypothetical protein
MNKNSAVCKCSNPVVLQCKPKPKEVYYCWCDSCMNGTSEPKRWVEVHKSIKSIINSNNRLHRKYTLPNRPKVHRVMCKDCDECLAMFYESSSFASLPPHSSRSNATSCNIFHNANRHGKKRGAGPSFPSFPNNTVRNEWVRKVTASPPSNQKRSKQKRSKLTKQH